MPKAESTDLGLSGPGVEPFKIKSIDKLAVKYVEARDSRMMLTKNECTARDKLIEEVKAHESEIGHNEKGEVVYRFDDLKVVYKPGKPSIKVRSADDESEGDKD